MSEVPVATPATEEVKMEVETASSALTEVKEAESGPATVPPTVQKAEGTDELAHSTQTSETQSDEMKRAVRQGAFSESISWTTLFTVHITVEFYFADSNLPFDK